MKKMKNKKIQESGTVSTPRILIINMWVKGFSSYMTGVGSISSNNKNGSQSVGSSSDPLRDIADERPRGTERGRHHSHPRYVPVRDVTIKPCRVLEHISHVRHARHVPPRDVAIKVGTLKHTDHTRHAGHVSPREVAIEVHIFEHKIHDRDF